MSERAEPVLAAALERLITQGTLTREQAEAVRADFHAGLTDQPERNGNSWTPILAEVGGYVGAAFVVAAAVALVGPGWDNFSTAARIAVLAVPAVLLLVAAGVVGAAVPGGWSSRFFGTKQAPAEDAEDTDRDAALRRLISVLILAGGGLLGGAAAVISPDFESDHWVPLVPLLVWAVGYRLCRGVPLHLGTAVALTWTVYSLVDLSSGLDDRIALSGLLMALAGATWAALARYRLIDERALAIAVAGVMAFIGGEDAITSEYEGLGYPILAVIVVAGLTGYVRTRELSALGVGACALAVLVPQMVIDYTEGSLGAAGGLLVSGLSIVAVSVLAARLRRSTSGPTQLV
jgi:hypothetical protein